MSTGFLTAADRERLNRFPAQIPDEDLSAFFLLSDADQQAINQHREAHTRLGFALQLCALRYLGFAPDDLATAPIAAVEYIAHQLGWRRRDSTRMASAVPHVPSISSRCSFISTSASPPRWICMHSKRG
jgi:TnpA family transposase